MVSGYWVNSGVPEVYILNPNPVGKGYAHWATYETYLSSETTADDKIKYHNIAKTLTNIQWAPSICQYDFSELDSSLYGQCLQQWEHHGQWPSALASSNGMMSGSFGGTNSAVVAWGHTESEMQDAINSQGPGSRPTFITVNSGTTPTFDAVWALEGDTWGWVPEESANQFETNDTEYKNDGKHVRDLFVYQDNGAVAYSVVWVQEAGANDIWQLAENIGAFKVTDSNNRGAGYRLVRISTYVDANGVLNAAGLWFPSTVSDYYWVAGLSPSDYQAAFNTWVGTNGYTLDYISMYNGTYNAIFIKN